MTDKLLRKGELTDADRVYREVAERVLRETGLASVIVFYDPTIKNGHVITAHADDPLIKGRRKMNPRRIVEALSLLSDRVMSDDEAKTLAAEMFQRS